MLWGTEKVKFLCIRKFSFYILNEIKSVVDITEKEKFLCIRKFSFLKYFEL
jgi:hypothetical protein